MEEIAFFNGKFLPLQEVKVSVFETGFLSGLGLFESMRAYHNRIVYFNQHLHRIRDSSRLMEIEFPSSLKKMKQTIQQTVKINRLNDAYVRLTLWPAKKQTNILIVTRTYKPFSILDYQKGFSAGIAKFRQNENSPLAGIKSTNRILYELAYRQAKKKGFAEAVILNNRGYLTEGTRSNIFFVKDKEIFTPSLACGCLGGITRRVIFVLARKYNIIVQEGNFTLKDLYAAEEAFLTNSLMGIMPLSAVEKKIIGRGAKFFKVAHFFRQKYNLLLKYGI